MAYLHEFSSIPGVKEDVTEIIMNIKNLAIKNTVATNEPKAAYIEFEGEGVVTAADIQADPDIEILNPDLVIATFKWWCGLQIIYGTYHYKGQRLCQCGEE